ncbi:hypothetical protein [uncultured Polaribacter sp.]|uniref:hypothetical protein n=1 Tax=uncultured Polaribacter sp. TaxID=174711 RepID=UPI0026235851|nr:hypothetical protein [uncultured Polaribacter sp.]
MDRFNINEGNFKSLQQELRFKIGEQYELNEFNLKSIESTLQNGIEYENYEYIKGDLKALFGIEFTSNIVLQYNGDILSKVVYEFHQKHYNYLYSKIKNYGINETILEVFIKDENICQIALKKNLEAHF